MNAENIVFVVSHIPPDFQGAGKRIYSFYKFLRKSEDSDKLFLVTTTKNNVDSHIKSIATANTKGSLSRLKLIINFFLSFFQVFYLAFTLKSKKNRKNVVWLGGTTPLTFAASIVFYLRGFKIITQNSLVASDDPEHRYLRDILSIKYSLKKLQYKLSDAVTSISPALYNISTKYHDNCVMIPNPVDLDTFKSNNEINARRLKKRVLIVGTLYYRKGTDIVLKTIQEINKKNSDIEFVFVGPDAKLPGLCEDEGIDLSAILKYKVNFKGYVKKPTQYYKEASLFFLPSRREGFGSVYIEAMAAGLPVVAKKIEGITDYIFGDDYPGIHNTEDTQIYADSILDILHDEKLYKNLVQKGIEKVQRFEQQQIYKEYLNLIDQQ